MAEPTQQEINVKIMEQLTLLLTQSAEAKAERERQQAQLDSLLSIDKAKEKIVKEAAMRATGDFSKLKEPKTPIQQRNQKVMEEASRKVKELKDTATTDATSTASGGGKAKKYSLGDKIQCLQRTDNCEDWFRLFDILIAPFGANDPSKIVTLYSLLTVETVQWLAGLPEESRITYGAMKLAIQSEWKVKTYAGLGDLQRFIDMEQENEQPVSTYHSIFVERAKRLADGGQPVSDLLQTATFLGGLLPEIQSRVRANSVSTDTLERLRELAVDAETAVAEQREAEKRRAAREAERARVNNNNRPKATGNYSNNTGSYSNNNNSTTRVNTNPCRDCGAQTINANHDRCHRCHGAAKERGDATCSKCHVAKAVPHQGWCQACFDASKKSASGQQQPQVQQQRQQYSPQQKFTRPCNPADFVTVQVPFRHVNNESANPIDWKTAKLKENSLCAFCTKPTGAGHDCAKKYPFYMPDEVRSILFDGKVPVARTYFPPGQRTWKGQT
jgi:hypothetical protein